MFGGQTGPNCPLEVNDNPRRNRASKSTFLRLIKVGILGVTNF
jgi:hypothetical protein